jgi:hypothetical protein
MDLTAREYLVARRVRARQGGSIMRWVFVLVVLSLSCGIKGPPLPPIDAPNAATPLLDPPDAGPCCLDKAPK